MNYPVPSLPQIIPNYSGIISEEKNLVILEFLLLKRETLIRAYVQNIQPCKRTNNT